jgi:nucleotide-binding universal stress UspA family protein
MLAVKTILHPTDFSPGSDLAFRLACALARDYGARLVVLHVASIPVFGYGEGLISRDPVCYEPVWAELEKVRPADPAVDVDHRLAEGVAGLEIVREAENARADLIVMGTHGRTGLGRLLMGSVAEEVVRKAPCPVVTIKAPPARAAEGMAG